MIEANNPIDVNESEIDPFRESVETMLTGYPFGNKTLSLPVLIQKIDSSEPYIMTDCERSMYLAVRTGCQIFKAVAKLLSDKTGLRKHLIQPDPDKSLVNRLRHFCYNYATFAASLYIARMANAQLTDKDEPYANPDLDMLSLEYDLPEDSAIRRLLAPLYARLNQHQDGRDFFPVPSMFPGYLKTLFECYADLAQKNATGYGRDLTVHLDGYQFRIMDETLVLSGYTNKSIQRVSTRTDRPAFQPVHEQDIVGNRSAKIALRRYSDRLALYDPDAQMNPVMDLGGLSWSNLFDGPPGTGKTSLFRFVMTRLTQLADSVGLPLAIVTIDQSIKDEFYGKTGKILLERLSVTSDPASLSLVIMDDIDLLTTSRDTGQGADNDVTNILMQYLDGAYTVKRGNVINFAASNKPSGLDDAFRNRFANRIYIDGPVTAEDFSDMVHIMGRKLIENGLISMEDGYTPFDSQRIMSTGLSQAMAEQVADVLQPGKTATVADFGRYMLSLKEKNPAITGRSVRSIMDNVKEHCADFEIPSSWFENPAEFQVKPYETKKAMLCELYKPVSPELLFKEAFRYFESEQRYSQTETENAVQSRYQAMKNDIGAQIRFYDEQSSQGQDSMMNRLISLKEKHASGNGGDGQRGQS